MWRTLSCPPCAGSSVTPERDKVRETRSERQGSERQGIETGGTSLLRRELDRVRRAPVALCGERQGQRDTEIETQGRETGKRDRETPVCYVEDSIVSNERDISERQGHRTLRQEHQNFPFGPQSNMAPIFHTSYHAPRAPPPPNQHQPNLPIEVHPYNSPQTNLAQSIKPAISSSQESVA